MGTTFKELEGLDLNVIRSCCRLSNVDASSLVQPIGEEEIKHALLHMEVGKALGIDGYTVLIYMKCLEYSQRIHHRSCQVVL